MFHTVMKFWHWFVKNKNLKTHLHTEMYREMVQQTEIHVITKEVYKNV
jgi:hypothetical protein